MASRADNTVHLNEENKPWLERKEIFHVLDRLGKAIDHLTVFLLPSPFKTCLSGEELQPWSYPCPPWRCFPWFTISGTGKWNKEGKLCFSYGSQECSSFWTSITRFSQQWNKSCRQLTSLNTDLGPSAVKIHKDAWTSSRLSLSADWHSLALCRLKTGSGAIHGVWSLSSQF